MLPPDLLSDSTVSPELKVLVNPEQMFRMIDTLLPFEACLYHQVLPLSFQGEYLNLGVVTLNDRSALDYVQHLLGSISCVILPTPIESKFHQNMLSAYLRYTEQKRQSSEGSGVSQEKTKRSAPPPDQTKPELLPTEQDTFILTDTFILEDNPHVNEHPDAPPLFPISPVTSQAESSVLLQDTPEPAAAWSSPLSPPVLPPVPPLLPKIPELNLRLNYLSSPIAMLQTLPPSELLQELLGRVLVGGIGRLYLERQEQSGRILWSQSGVLQSVLEHLPLPIFDQVIQELKTIAEIPSDPISGTQQVELERSYQKSRILLRIRFMHSRYGEEGTLQVLRGAALKFYEKKQIDRLGKDALSIAQQLQRKLETIRTDRDNLEAATETTENSTLSELSHILDSLNETLKKLD
jgi:hypothetical protein